MAVANAAPSKTERAHLRELATDVGGTVWMALLFGPCAADYVELGGKRKAMRLLKACWREIEHDTQAPYDLYAEQREAFERGEEWTKDPRAFRPPAYDPTRVLSHSDGCWGCQTFGRTERP